jgi:hypothetical protein
MAIRRIRYLVGKKGAGNTTRWWWQPSGALRAQRFKPVRLGRDDRTPWGKPAPGAVCDEAERWNARLDAWKKGKGPHPFEDDKPAACPAGGTAGPRKQMKTGTVDALIRRYKGAHAFLKLRESTRKMYSENLEIISRWAGDVPVRDLDIQMALAFYDEMYPRTPTKANHVMVVLRLLYSFARRRGGTERVLENPFMKPGLEWNRGKPRIWTPAEIECFARHADNLGRWSVGTAVILNEWIGQREGDVLGLCRTTYQVGALRFEQLKTKVEVDLPVDLVPRLSQWLREETARWAARKVMPTTLIASEATGRPYSVHAFYHVFREVREAAAKERPDMAGLWFMRLRHTAVVRLGEAGATVPQIAAVTGHALSSCEAILERYNVRTKKAAASAFRQRLKAEASEANEHSSEGASLR